MAVNLSVYCSLTFFNSITDMLNFLKSVTTLKKQRSSQNAEGNPAAAVSPGRQMGQSESLPNLDNPEQKKKQSEPHHKDTFQKPD